MAKYFIEETTLKNMADTIRSLTGSTATLTPGQMVNEVQVAENNIDEVMNVIESLGVEIPEGSDIGDLADLVGNIEAGADTSDATAIAEDIMAGKTAYIADGKTTGSFTIDNELTEQNELISQISNLVATKASGTEDLDTELTTQESLISQLSTILDSKASGGSSGGSVETCTVNISSFYNGNSGSIIYTSVENNSIVHKHLVYGNDYTTFPVTLNNVLCNSAIVYTGDGTFIRIEGDVEEIRRYGNLRTYRSPLEKDAIATITEYLD